MHVLVPVQYPLTDTNRRAIGRATELLTDASNPELLVFHLNEIQSDRRIDRRTLREAVETEFEGLEATYLVRDGFLVEEAIIEEAIRLEMDYIVLSEDRRNRWRRLLDTLFDVEQSPEEFIRDHTGIHVEVVSEPDSDGDDP